MHRHWQDFWCLVKSCCRRKRFGQCMQISGSDSLSAAARRFPRLNISLPNHFDSWNPATSISYRRSSLTTMLIFLSSTTRFPRAAVETGPSMFTKVLTFHEANLTRAPAGRLRRVPPNSGCFEAETLHIRGVASPLRMEDYGRRDSDNIKFK